VVEAQHAADAFAPLHAPVVVCRRCALDDQRVGQALMRTLEAILRDELRHEQPKMIFTAWRDVIQALGFHPVLARTR
jgi:hypothetical protein